MLPLVLKRNFGNALMAFTSVIGASYFYLQTAKPLYESSARLILDERRTSVSELGQALASTPVPGNANPIATQAELVTSKRIVERAVDLMIQAKGFPRKTIPSVDEISSSIKVKIVPATNILELSYQNPNPRLAAAVLNAVAEATVQENAKSIRQEASAVRQFLESRLPEQRANLQRLELTESQFKQANGIVSVDTQDTSLVNSLTTVEDQGRALAAQLQQDQRKSELLQGITGINGVQDAYRSSRAGQDEQLKVLRAKLTDLETKIIDARSRLGDQHPDLLALIQERDETATLYSQQLARVIPGSSATAANKIAGDDLSRDLLSNYINGEVDRNAMIDKLKALRDQHAELRLQIANFPAKQQVLTSLVRQREQEAATLKLLQDKLEEARIAEAQLISNIRVISLASVPESPSSPKPKVVLILAAVIGSALAVGVVLLGEVLNNTIDTATEAEGRLKLPILGILPHRLQPLSPARLERFLNNPVKVDPYRRLLKTLESQGENQLRSLIISSSTIGEGKSDVAARLAVVAALSSRRILLIDADLSHPLQHQFFGLPEQPGLTDALSNTVPLSSAVQPTEIANLDILPHGQWSNQPAKFLEAASMKKLLADAVAYYDLVIIDTSAVTQYADAMALGQYTDGIVLVVRPRFTRINVSLQTIIDLQKSGSKVLGLIANTTPDPAKAIFSDVIRKIQSNRSISST
jgi:capsular exopolysaccharide synthesis family protein